MCRSLLIPKFRGSLIALGALTLCGLLGCGPSLPKTYPVNGKVEVKGAKLRQNSFIRFTLNSDVSVVAEGLIQEDGSFKMITKMYGVEKPGAAEGEHSVMIIEGAPPGEALPITIDPISVQKTVTVEPRTNDVTISAEKAKRRGGAPKQGI